ncbi:MAG: hypothetical protein ABI868_08060 [Acidobacteriota bacterium]
MTRLSPPTALGREDAALALPPPLKAMAQVGESAARAPQSPVAEAADAAGVSRAS